MRQPTKNADRNVDFDVLRTIIIFSAIVLHFNASYSLQPFAYPFQFVDQYLFKVGHFFFLTAGYMGCLIYEKKMKINLFGQSIKIVTKGLHVLCVYIGYVLLMRLLTNDSFPINLYDFLWRHTFYTKVLVTFAMLYIISPLIIILYIYNKFFLYTMMIILYISYTNYYLTCDMDSYFLGIFYGIGNKDIFYSFSSAIILYCIGYIICDVERNNKFKQHKISSGSIIFYVALTAIVIHVMLVIMTPWYVDVIKSRKISIIITAILMVASIVVTRKLLLHSAISSFFMKRNYLVIGAKSLTFYVISNLFLGLLKLPNDLGTFHNLMIFLSIISLSYLFTVWHYHSEKRDRSCLLVPKVGPAVAPDSTAGVEVAGGAR